MDEEKDEIETPSTEEVNKALEDQDAADERAEASVDAYREAIGDGGPTGAEPITDLDGKEVSPQDMPSSGVWAGQDPEAREGDGQGDAPGQEGNDEAEVDQGKILTQGSPEVVEGNDGQ